MNLSGVFNVNWVSCEYNDNRIKRKNKNKEKRIRIER